MELTIQLSAEPLPRSDKSRLNEIRSLVNRVGRNVLKVTIDRTAPLSTYNLEAAVKGLLTEEDKKSLLFVRFISSRGKKEVDLTKSYNDLVETTNENVRNVTLTAEFFAK